MNCVFKVVKHNGDIEWVQDRNCNNIFKKQNNIIKQKDVEACIIFVLYDEYDVVETKRKRLSIKLANIKYELERNDDE